MVPFRQPVANLVIGQGEDPGGQLAAALETGEAPMHGQICLLQDVLDNGDVMEIPAHIGGQPGIGTVEKPAEGLLTSRMAGSNLRDETGGIDFPVRVASIQVGWLAEGNGYYQEMPSGMETVHRWSGILLAGEDR
jgi:hypothetical protein